MRLRAVLGNDGRTTLLARGTPPRYRRAGIWRVRAVGQEMTTTSRLGRAARDRSRSLRTETGR
jgi:hypothetical protein